MNSIRMSNSLDPDQGQPFVGPDLGPNSLDPDQGQPFVGPDLGPNCLLRLSADKSSQFFLSSQACKNLIKGKQKYA